MAVKICEHIKASGFRCGSPAAKGERLCYFHKGLGQALPIRSVLFDPRLDQQADPAGAPRIMMMPLLEDAASIQMAYMQVLGAILYNEVDTRKGRAMLSAIHGAQRNLKVVKREMATVEKRPAKLYRGRWGRRTKGNPDALASAPDEFVGDKTRERSELQKKAQAEVDEAMAKFEASKKTPALAIVKKDEDFA
jgi:hypothetical protein